MNTMNGQAADVMTFHIMSDIQCPDLSGLIVDKAKPR